MADRTVARRYAAAFLDLAQELGTITRFGEDLDETLEAVRSDDGVLLRVLANPVFTADERRDLLSAIVPKLELHPMTVNLLRLLSDRGRFGVLPDLVTIYHAEADVLAGRLRVQVTTADPLTAELAGEIRSVLARTTGKEIVLETHVDAALIGGLVARVGGKVYDGSVRARLDDLKYRLIHGTTPGQA